MRPALYSVLLFSLIALSGCGSDPTADLGTSVTVTGTITMDDKPADGVEVIFQRTDSGAPAEYRQYVATTDASGKYSLDDVYPAKYLVMVNEKNDDSGEDEEEMAIDTGPYKKYGVDSELTADVTDTNNTIDFELSSK
ncbi:hypothetical protein Mal35_46980 [Gimesia maris]|uniref:carboxypeptidase-like regulatory domain-containing protein n=1 Tax=Gimesia maris TaxID=122 RepID=UPI00118CEE23|nr:carboxypeptidase-like regulatory domain-containing protein [Gimesia maris]QDT81218.1 hypothetical protein Mal35_46980 [Gimesia maris]